MNCHGYNIDRITVLQNENNINNKKRFHMSVTGVMLYPVLV